MTKVKLLSLGEVLRRALFLYRKQFRLFVGIMAVPRLVCLIVVTLANLLLRVTGVSGEFSYVGGMGGVLIIAGTLIFVAAYCLNYCTAYAATAFAVSDLSASKGTSVSQTYLGVRDKVLRLFVLSLALMLALGLGFALLILPGILVAVWYAMTIPVVVFENLDIGGAFRRSEALSKGARGNIFLVLLLFSILNYICGYFSGTFSALFTTTILQKVLPERLFWLPGTVSTLASSSLVLPLLTISLSVIYFDLRMKKEGLAIETAVRLPSTSASIETAT